MTQTRKVTIEIPEEIYQKIKSLEDFRDRPEKRRLVHDAMKYVDGSSTIFHELWLGTSTQYAHIDERSFPEYVRDCIIAEWSQYYDTAEEFYHAVNHDHGEASDALFEPAFIDGSYTYSTFESNRLLFSFYNDIEYDKDIDPNPFDKPELFLVYKIAEIAPRVLNCALDAYHEQTDCDDSCPDDCDGTQGEVHKTSFVDVLENLKGYELDKYCY